MSDPLTEAVTAELASTELRAAVGAGAPVLSIVWHPQPRFVGHRLSLPAGHTIELGRGGDAVGPGALEDRRLSRHHAAFTRESTTITVEDLDSSNGTRLNGVDVTEPTALDMWDVVQIGRIMLMVQPPPAPFDAPEPAELVGRSTPVTAARQQLCAVADRRTVVLLHGEAGTGKRLAGRLLHQLSGRDGRLVEIDCGAQSDLPLATRLDEAADGTLLLHAIHLASAEDQATLLALLEAGCVPTAVGGARPQHVRVVATTDHELDDAVAAGTLRQDLATRLGRWVLRLPPLRDRRGDVPALIAAFARQEAGRPMKVQRRLTLRLLRHRWPGNVAELEDVVGRLVREFSDSDTLEEPSWLAESLAVMAVSTRPVARSGHLQDRTTARAVPLPSNLPTRPEVDPLEPTLGPTVGRTRGDGS